MKKKISRILKEAGLITLVIGTAGTLTGQIILH